VFFSALKVDKINKTGSKNNYCRSKLFIWVSCGLYKSVLRFSDIRTNHGDVTWHNGSTKHRIIVKYQQIWAMGIFGTLGIL